MEANDSTDIQKDLDRSTVTLTGDECKVQNMVQELLARAQEREVGVFVAHRFGVSKLLLPSKSKT